MAKKKQSIDKCYFESYAGSGKAYNDVYREHSGVDDCIVYFQADDAPKVRSICVLGAATGMVVEDLYRAFGVLPYGCEINEWAHGQILKKYRKRIERMDLRDYTLLLNRKRRVFDLGFSNSLVYLPQSELKPIIKRLARSFRFIHFDSSFLGNACPDPYRKTLKSYDWWNKLFTEAGFDEMTTVFGSKTYIWKSRIAPAKSTKTKAT